MKDQLAILDPWNIFVSCHSYTFRSGNSNRLLGEYPIPTFKSHLVHEQSVSLVFVHISKCPEGKIKCLLQSFRTHRTEGTMTLRLVTLCFNHNGRSS